MDSPALSPHVPRRRWSSDEKQRIVELTQREGASIGAIAREHGLDPSVVSKWRTLYRDGKLADRPSRRATCKAAPPATFLPVTMRNEDAIAASSVQIALPSGVVLRIDTPRLDMEVLCVGAAVRNLPLSAVRE